MIATPWKVGLVCYSPLYKVFCENVEPKRCLSEWDNVNRNIQNLRIIALFVNFIKYRLAFSWPVRMFLLALFKEFKNIHNQCSCNMSANAMLIHIWLLSKWSELICHTFTHRTSHLLHLIYSCSIGASCKQWQWNFIISKDDYKMRPGGWQPLY